MDRPDDLTDQERWQWAEAEFCDLMHKELLGMIPGWLERGNRNHPTNFENALSCSLKAEAWEQMGRHLRQPYYMRKEQEACRADGRVQQ